mmetsp:Transcript_8616/g.18661  ORF Transcript_8616/g.18661 Transcript_8616/m.18661 type:complete len:244 (+) Transcript_8616:89-820(+)
MSKLSDYSKFDHLVDSDDEKEEQPPRPPSTHRQPPVLTPTTIQTTNHPLSSSTTTSSTPTTRFERHPQHEARFILKYGDRSIYEWEQTLHEVTLFIPTPPLPDATALVCEILPRRLRVGLRRNAGQYFLNQATGGVVDVAASTWTWEGRNAKATTTNLLTIELQKANKGVVWETVCCGGDDDDDDNNTPTPEVALDPMQLEQERQRLLLERWQEENPGMDFRGATFNGSVPDPRTYMGGVRYD